MADVKFSEFDVGGEMQVGDIPVGLRTGQPTKNFQFDFPGAGIKDSSGNYLFEYATAGALAVNHLKLVSGLTTNAAILTAVGDTNVDISFIPGGTGGLVLDGLRWPTSDGAPNTLMYTNGSGILGFSTLIAGSNVSINNIGTSITISASGSGGGFSWNVVTGTSQNMAVNNGYISNNAGLVTLNLPATSLVGDAIAVTGKGAGGWVVQCGVGQTIVLGSSTTSSGGTIASTNAKDSFYMICTSANTEWTIASAPQSSGLTIT
jgi:hypothetical protein